MSGPREFAETYVTADTMDAEMAGWMDAIGPYQWRRVEPLDRTSAALIVVDMTRPFVDDSRPLSSPNARAIVGRVARLVHSFRAANQPVLWVAQGHVSVAHDRGVHLSTWWPLPLLEGTDDVEPAVGLAPRRHEKIIMKRRYSGFYQTDLELTLRCLGVRHVVVAGTMTHTDVMITAMDAFERDYTVYIPPDATASLNRALHIGALQSLAGWTGFITPTAELTAQLGVGELAGSRTR